MKKIITMAILSFVLLFCGLCSANAATLTVTKIADTNDNVCNSDCSLREAIFAAVSGDVIVFASPLFNSAQTITLSSELSVNKTLTINGRGANLTTISGGNVVRVFYTDGDLTLNGLTVTGGKIPNGTKGGGIYNNTGKILKINDCVISGNSGSYTLYSSAAGIYNAGQTTITGSTISNNVTGGYYNNGGGVYNDAGTLVIESSTLFGNVSGSGDTSVGGGIYSYNGTTILTNSTVSGNTASGATDTNGGGITAYYGTLTLTNTTVSRNTAKAGGGIYTFSVTIKARNTIISGNTATTNPDLYGTLNVNSNNYIGGDARLSPLGYYGGATPTHALLTDSPAIDTGNGCVLRESDCGDGNAALTTDQRGGGFPRARGANVDIGAFEKQPPRTLFVTKIADTNDNVCNADCSLREAISAAAASDDVIEFVSPLFDSPQIITLAFGEFYIYKALTINGRGANLTTISGGNLSRVINAGENITLNGLTVTNGRDTGAGGGGIYNSAGRVLRINGCHISGNSVSHPIAANGGGIHNRGTLRIENSTLSGNVANSSSGSYGGAIYNLDGTVILINSTISGNTTSGSMYNNFGGGIYTSDGLTVMTNATVSLNSNGGVYKSGGRVHAVNTIMSGNIRSDYEGSNINTNFNNYIGGDARLSPLGYYGGATPTQVPASDSPVINAGSNCVLTANQCGGNISNAALATDQRGGEFSRQFGANVDIGAVEAARVVTNTNNSGAGSLRQTISQAAAGETITFDPSFFNQPRTIFDRLDIFRNLTIIGPGSDFLTINASGGGRVLNIDGATVTISGIRFTNGNAGANVSAGGILINGGTLNATRIAVDNCTAGPLGGGIYNFGALNLSDSSVSNNSANNAAGIYNETGKTAVIQNSTVAGNTATVSSGGIGNNGTLNFYNSTLSGNTAPLGGGSGNGGSANFADSTISGNRATNNKGAGIYNSSGATVQLLNTTITNNQADSFAGAGIWNDNFGSSPVTVRAINTIIAGNISGNGNPVDYVGSISNPGNNLINVGNIGLAPLGNYGGATPMHALLSNSPALNAGSDCVLTANGCSGFTHSALTTDQRGANAQRKIGASVDIGAFERNISFDQTTLPGGNQTTAYSQQLSVSRQTNFAEDAAMSKTAVVLHSESNPDAVQLAPFTFSVVSIAGQQLPPSLTLSSSGILSGTPTQTGLFTFTVKAVDADGMAGASQFTVPIFGPTAAGVSISGRILTPDGRGLTNATVTLTDASGNTRIARTSTFGYYRFDEVEVGHTYVMGVRSKRFQFSPQVISVNEDVTELNLTAIE